MALREVLASFGIDVDDAALKAAAAKIQQYEDSLKKLSKEELAQLAAYKKAAAEQADVAQKAADAQAAVDKAQQAADKAAAAEAQKKAEADKKAALEAKERAKQQQALVNQLRAEFIVNAAKQVVQAFTGLIKSSIDLASSIGDTADKLGVSTTELQQFQFAGRVAGVSAEGMSQSLGFLNKGLGEAGAGAGPAKDTFIKLGIAIKDGNGHLKSATELFPQIADKVNALGSQGEKTAAVMAIFGRSGAELLPLFKDGSKGIEEALAKFKELGLEIDKNFIGQAHEVGDQVETMGIQFDVLKTKLVASALPSLKTLFEFILKLGAGLGKLLETTNASIIVFATFAGGALVAMIAGVRSLAVAIGVTESELLIVVAIFALVALAVEDVYTLFTGGDSVLGRFIDKMFGVGASKAFVAEVKKEATALWEQFKTILPDLEKLGAQLIEAFRAASPYIASFVKGTLTVVAATLKVIVLLISGLITVWGLMFKAGQGAFKIMSGELEGAKAAISTFIDICKYALDLIGKVTSGIPGVSALLGGPAKATASNVAGGKGGTANVNNQTQTTINVNGADQPQSVASKVANAVGNTVETQARNAYNAVASWL